MKLQTNTIIAGVLTIVLFASCNQSAVNKSKPNVLMIVVDDMNDYGYNNAYPLVKTPYLDKLAEESINFRNAACNSPVCNPSRSSFFSGLHPHTTGAYLNGSDGWNRSELLKEIKNIPEWFKLNGYTTWGRGKLLHNPLSKERERAMWDNKHVYKGGFGPFPEKEYWFGNSKFRSIKGYDNDTVFPDVKNANAAIEFLQKDHEKPFFMCYGLWRPHSPYTAPQRFFDMYNEADFDLSDGYRKDDLEDTRFLGQMLVDSLKNYRKDQDSDDALL
ncbi:MAG: sulfatase-like hydrolase/transferase, partial [Bacteroidales bacterium]|nr:sulfatase-like hydrolase/transferase [Bacteroidales bacterium]